MTSKERIFRGSPHYYERVRGISLGENELDFLSLNVPPRCNYRCAFCLSGMGKKQKIQNPLTRRELYGIIIQAKNLGAFHVEISGEGEPLLYRRMLEDIVNFANSQGLHVSIFTNGSLITKDFLLFLIRKDASLVISLDYLDKEKYEHFVNRAGTYDAVIKNVELARSIFRRKIREENGYRVFPLAIHTIVTADNMDEIPRIREFAGDDIFLSIAPLMNRGNAQEHSELLLSRKEVNSIINQYSDGSLIVSDTSIRDVGKPVCGTFYYGIGIRYDGEALFDAHAYETPGLFGNVRNLSLRRLIDRVREAKRIYFERFWDSGFCPLRNPSFDNFVKYLKER